MKDLIIFSGQSNMQGETNKPPESNKPIIGGEEYRYASNSFRLLMHPVGENLDKEGRIFEPDYADLPLLLQKSSLLAPYKNYGNMVPYFCDEYIKMTGRNVVAVHAARGSSNIDYWLSPNIGYRSLVKKTKAALELVDPKRVFLIWLQGESDAIRGLSKAEYKEKLIRLNELLKRDIGIEKFCNILVGRFVYDSRDFEIINAQKEVCRENADFLMLTEATEYLTEDKEYMNPIVAGHYNIKGLELIGREAGKTLAEYVIKTNTLPI